MKKTLKEKMDEIADAHADEVVSERFEIHKERRKAEAFIMIGKLSATSSIARGMSELLNAQELRGWMHFQAEKMYEDLGFPNFDSFLQEHPDSPMKKSKYYQRKDLLESEGDAGFDYLNQLGLPVSIRKLLAESSAGAITVENGSVKIGDTEIAANEHDLIKEIIKGLANDVRVAKEETTKKAAKIDELENSVTQGRKELEERNRAIDAMQDGSAYERALTNAVGAMIKLAIEAKNLPVVEKERRGKNDINALWQQMKLVRSELYQDDFAFIEERNHNASGDSVLSDIAKQVISEDDDFGDEYEQ